jgi:ribosomal protein S18 acetylase RimI-like enzyme
MVLDRPLPSVRVRRIDLDHARQTTFVEQAATVLHGLVAAGAGLGWVIPPGHDEVADLLSDVAAAANRDEACLVAAWVASDLAGLGYWRRYARPTHRPHADVEKIAVASPYQGRGVGRSLMTELISAAVGSQIEVLTLDFRDDNDRAAKLYESLGFAEYGRLHRFVAIGSARYDKIFYARDLREGRRRGSEPTDRDS